MQIRKTALTIKGGPGGVGISYNKADKQVHLHDGTTDRVVRVGVAGYTTKTAAYSVVLPDDDGKILKMSLLAGFTVTLPAVSSANKGMRITVVNGLLPTSGAGYAVSPNASDRLGFLADDTDLTNSAASDALGDLLTLESDGVDGWIILAKIGTWA